MISRKKTRLQIKPVRITRSSASEITRALQLATASGDEGTVKRLLNINAKVDPKNRRNRTKTLLHIASKAGHLEVVKALLDRGASLNEASELFYNCTPLHLAALEGHVEALLVLLSRGAFVHAKNKFGRTPLHLTAYHNKTECAGLLVGFGADVNAKDDYNFTPLHLAARNGAVEIARKLLMMGADATAASNSDATPLHLAASKGKTDIVKLFIDHKAPLDVRDMNHKTPLYYAVLENEIETAELLFSHQNLDINDFLARERWDLTGDSLLYIKSMLDRVKTVKWLLSKGADVTAANQQEWTALHAAAGNPLVVEMLLQAGASVDSETDWDETPLLLAAEIGCGKSVNLLLNAGASVNAPNVPGDTPLHLASGMDAAAVVNLLWSAGASVNAEGEFGNTPLHIAAKYGNTKVVKILLSIGADVNAANADLRTPLHLAMDTEDPDILPEHKCIKALQQHVVKMMTLNLFVSESNRRAVGSDFRMLLFRLKCEKEIGLMKSKKIANGVSFFDILTRNAGQLAGYARNTDIQRVFKSTACLSNFPIYGSEIKKRFIPAIERAKLLESGHSFFAIFLAGLPRLQLICTEEILALLSNSDLQLLRDLVKSEKSSYL